MKIRKIDFVFARVRFASDARHVMHLERYTLDEVAAVANRSTAAVSSMLTGMHENPEMLTFLGVCNALDLNPVNYFDLME